MSYTSEWMPAVDTIAHIIRTDGCDKAGATQQIEAAVRDGVLRWVKGGAIVRTGTRRYLALIS
jgi:hypothetical protein